MNMVLECDVVLSKKLEAVCENGEPISIHITSVSGNKGRAVVRMSCKDGTSENDLAKIGETSVMLKINSATDDIKTLGESRRVGNLVGGMVPTAMEVAIARTSPHVPEGEPYRKPVSAQASFDPEPVPAARRIEPASTASNAMESAAANPQAMNLIMAALAAAGIPIPAEFRNVQASTQSNASPPAVSRTVPRDNCIMTYDELMDEIDGLPNIDNVPQLPTNRKLTPREAETITSQMPRLRRKAYLRNNLQSQFMIADLFTTIDGGGSCLAMFPGAAFDLARIPARNIKNSTELKWCFETGKVELVNSATYVASFKKVEEAYNSWDKTGGLPIYGGEVARTSPHDSSGGAAESIAAGSAMVDERESIHIGGQGPDPVSISIGGGANDAPPAEVYEENPLMQQLVGAMPRERMVPSPQPRRMR